MREYTVNFNEEEVKLPKYTFDIANKIEKQEVTNSGNSKFQDKCRSMHSLLESLLGKEKISELLGSFKDSDPNDINILYLSIVQAYSDPVEQFNMESTQRTIDNANLDSLKDFLTVFEKASKVKTDK